MLSNWFYCVCHNILCLYLCVSFSAHMSACFYMSASLFAGLFGFPCLWFGKLVHLMFSFSSCKVLRVFEFVCIPLACCFWVCAVVQGRSSVLSVTLCLAVILDCLSVFLSWLLWDAACCWATSCLLPSSWPRDHHWHHKVVYGVGTKVSYIYQECEAIS